MKEKKNDIQYFYEALCDENNRLYRSKVDSIEFLTTMKYLKEHCPPGSSILDACAGCGVYAFPLAEAGYVVTAGDLVEYNVAQIQAKQNENPILNHIYTGSILDLSQFDDESFDVVLNFGSFYHLIDEKDREKAMQESLRVLKKGGLLFLAYLNKYSNFFKYNQQWNDNFFKFEEYFENGYNKSDQVFYGTTPEDIEQTMTQYSLQHLHNVATDGLKFAIKNSVNELSEDVFNRYLQLHFKMCEVKSLLGYSEHALYIGQKL